jgi:class 3 adenylate cyclase/pimeloyl-ACP methyl ester carboxylesterase
MPSWLVAEPRPSCPEHPCSSSTTLVPMAEEEEVPEIRYVSMDDDRIAYQVFGAGDVDLIFLSPSGDSIDSRWEWPAYASFLRQLGDSARVIMFDQRGRGVSDTPSGDALPSWERYADETRVVLDAVGSERAVLFGLTDSAATAVMFAATHPTRTQGLILGNATARFVATPDQPSELKRQEELSRFAQEAWGTEAFAQFGAPDAATDPAFRRWFAKSQRLSLRPREAAQLLRFEHTMDMRGALASVSAPTLVLHRAGWNIIAPDEGRYLAEQIRGARFALVPGYDGTFYTEPVGEILKHFADFLGALHGPVKSDRALAAILFTDIVDSTATAAALGDKEWRNLLEIHDVMARTIVAQHRGRLIKMTGDGMLVTFEGPGKAIACALALCDSLRPLGLEIRAGLHTGEIELRGTDIAGIGVHIAARVLEAASPGDLVVSGAVPMLVAGSGIEFEERGEHELKGVPGYWKLFAVRS